MCDGTPSLPYAVIYSFENIYHPRETVSSPFTSKENNVVRLIALAALAFISQAQAQPSSKLVKSEPVLNIQEQGYGKERLDAGEPSATPGNYQMTFYGYGGARRTVDPSPTQSADPTAAHWNWK